MDDFERGYEFAIRQGGGSYAAEVGAEYVREVEAAIVELYRRVNAYDYYKATKPAQESLKGFIAEEFAAGTANVDAAVKGSGERFAVLQSHDLGSVDVASTGAWTSSSRFTRTPIRLSARLVQLCSTSTMDRTPRHR